MYRQMYRQVSWMPRNLAGRRRTKSPYLMGFFPKLWILLDAAGLGNGAQGRNRTSDTAIFNRMLYQLSYLGPDAVPNVRDEPSAAL
jgi:hypothetical protein